MPIKNNTFMAHSGWRKKLDIWLCKRFGHKPVQSNSVIVGIFCSRCGKMASVKALPEGQIIICWDKNYSWNE